jgi:death-on-curing protein
MNHPFVDGNKRVGVSAAELFVIVNGWELPVSNVELEELTMTVARGELDVEPLTIWFRQRLVQQD